MEQSSAAGLSNRRGLQAEPFLDGGEQIMTRGVCSWVVTSLGSIAGAPLPGRRLWQAQGRAHHPLGSQ